MGLVIRLFIVLLLTFLASCGGSTGSSNVGDSGGSGGGTSSTLAAQHVVMVIFENQNYSEIIGSAVMPFFNSVADQNAAAIQFYANVHPSIGNYFVMTTGQTVTADNSFSGTYDGDNVVRRLTAAGKTWKVYAESLPAVGHVGGDVYPYVRRHNPFSYFTDAINDPAQRNNIVPFSEFAAAVSSNSLPHYSFVIPNNINNGHDCRDGTSNCHNDERLASIDAWFHGNFDPVLKNAQFMSSSILVATFDESANDNTNGGGLIPFIMAGSNVKKGYRSTRMYQFPSLLRMSLEALGVNAYPGAALDAPSMNEFAQ